MRNIKQFQRNDSCDDLEPHTVLRLPQTMLALHLMMAPTSYVDKWGLVDAGQLGPAVRRGWFIPWRTEQSSPPLYDHWKVFTDPASLSPFIPSEEQMEFIREHTRRNNERWEALLFYNYVNFLMK